MAQELKREQKGAEGSIRNQTYESIELDRSHIWSGLHIGVTFPRTISPNDEGKFVHLKGKDSAAKAMVQYSGSVTGQPYPYAWILAWDAPGEMMFGSKNKVYATGGFKHQIDALTTDEILARLEESTIIPPFPGPSPAGADAIIAEYPDMAFIQARFYLNKM